MLRRVTSTCTRRSVRAFTSGQKSNGMGTFKNDLEGMKKAVKEALDLAEQRYAGKISVTHEQFVKTLRKRLDKVKCENKGQVEAFRMACEYVLGPNMYKHYIYMREAAIVFNFVIIIAIVHQLFKITTSAVPNAGNAGAVARF